MVLAAINEAIRSAQELASSKLGGIAGGLGGLGGSAVRGCRDQHQRVRPARSEADH